MESRISLDQKTAGAKKGGASSPPKLSSGRASGPTKFLLKTEKELEKSAQRRGRKMSRSSTTSPSQSQETCQATPVASVMEDSSFGVQSLEETIGSTFPPDDHLLSRTASNSSEKSFNAGDYGNYISADDGMNINRRRKVGNRVHPTILATGQRIISSERVVQVAGSPVSTSQSPLRHSDTRRGSTSSSVHMDTQPATPLRLSPHPESTTPSTARSGSPKSFRLSDEESFDETNSQAVVSSSGDDDEQQVQHPPQLVMPSLSVPSRRPFTEQGRRIGRSKIMVIGEKGVGKTSLINSMYRCEHIVHMNGISNTFHCSSTETSGLGRKSTEEFTELKASTRPYPSWWTDFESRRISLRRGSIGEGVLERNLTFVDSPGFGGDDCVRRIKDHVEMTLRRTAKMESMCDSELVGLLSGDGGVQIDAVIYLVDSSPSHGSDATDSGLSSAHQELLQSLCKWTNVIPVISRSDRVTPETLEFRKNQLSHTLELLKAETYRITEQGDSHTPGIVEPLAVSLAPGEDAEIDASVLMSSQYLSPLVPSEFDILLSNLLAPDNIARMRHLAAIKFLLWRQENFGYHLDLHKQRLPNSPYLRSESPALTSNSSIPDESSRIIIPHSSSSYYRSTSPATSEISGNAIGTSTSALAQLSQQAQPSEPFRQVRLAKWAQDLQRSLANERRKYIEMYNNRTSEWSFDSDKADDHAVALSRPGRGRLGGDLGVIDPRDPLGVLAFGQAFRRRGFFVVKVVGSCGLLGAMAYVVMKNWADVQAFLGIGEQPAAMVHAAAVSPPPPPSTNSRHVLLGWIDEQFLRGFFGWKQ